ncbi:GTP-binding protein Rheb-like [Myxocyprinus asiaticus]|uniref:GTP-binding protein Rheb-like n=1 Tax=Myxocyprinus asiaticus TaxID=70543 RepID=UPI0022231E35|nr:GTP-binding protein Rheb-like [Myxocyprinus asiaticus]
MDIHGYVLVYSVTSMKRCVRSLLLDVYGVLESIFGKRRCPTWLSRPRAHIRRLHTRGPSTHIFWSDGISFEVVQVLHDKLLDMVGKIHWEQKRSSHGKPLVSSEKYWWCSIRIGRVFDTAHVKCRLKSRVIKPEEGKTLADSWGAAFMESSAKQNQTAVEVFKRIILEMERVDGNAPSEEKKCAVM